ncbi:uncharacterized protein K452DRAFT_236198 [Aplosporella prunicola CBS 121167]|uniref:Amino acid transporter transmembrane domain-containing protein n=1 Tax=Aplosporella prunicola CBS 121167 TaxID=1176127 RepID=A0A6A6B2F8_9PEZI|nr:uncharacterized protein K452DRAFT_236198 [Aplosporella prunicola CBS 121167]KAF2137207.1 hypothetical protein K452DRAFT_236198 [Aplosporella prunicola CBS 121167]
MSSSLAPASELADPRRSKEVDETINREIRTEPSALRVEYQHNPDITFEEYLYYANETREYEKTLSTKGHGLSSIRTVFSRDKKPKAEESTQTQEGQARPGGTGGPDATAGVFDVVSDEEWHQASRAARTATWGSVFYLITTDILGPYSVPWAFTRLGYGPGITLYFIFAVMATYSGYLLWQQFVHLDSDRYPVKNYGDLAFRIYGSWFRYIVNILQSCQFFLNVTLLIVSHGQSISQLSQPSDDDKPLCFTACLIIFAAAGFILGQIRSLQNLGYVANLAVWMNVFIIIMTMGITSNSSPNYKAVYASYGIEKGPIKTSAGVPDGLNLRDNINGLMQAVYSYGGATLFCELMAEMRRPWDFWKGMIIANVFIFIVYIVFGLVVYSEQGQFAFNPAYQGINPYAWQTVANAFSLVSGLIAACLYGNIGIKVLYANIGRPLLHLPALETRNGRWIWVAFVPLYWGLAFIIAAAVPQVSYLSSFVGAAMILQFSYTFPAFLALGFNCLKGSLVEGDGFDPTTGRVVRSDTGVKRWVRGFKKQLLLNSFNTVYFLGSIVTAVLGIYSSIHSMHRQYTTGGSVESFSCNSPTG